MLTTIPQLPKEAQNAMLHEIYHNTTDGDALTKVKSFIVYNATSSAYNPEINDFIDKQMLSILNQEGCN